MLSRNIRCSLITSVFETDSLHPKLAAAAIVWQPRAVWGDRISVTARYVPNAYSPSTDPRAALLVVGLVGLITYVHFDSYWTAE